MISAVLLLWCELLSVVPRPDTGPGQSGSDLETYKAAASQAGRDPDAHVKLALWCEAHGLSTERTRAVDAGRPARPVACAARGLLGLVAYDGQVAASGAGQQIDSRECGPREPSRRVPEETREDAGPGRGSMETRPLVRTERLEATSDRPSLSRADARPIERRGVEAPRLQEIGGSLEQARANCRGQGRGSGAAQSECSLESDTGETCRSALAARTRLAARKRRRPLRR